MHRFWSWISVFFTVTLISATPALAQDCFPSSPTADDIAVQASLDATAAAGGGVVQLEPRVYVMTQPLVVGPNTHLRGAGRGATILRGAAFISNKVISGIPVQASISVVGSMNVTISDLTVDHKTCARPGNGVELLPSESIHEGPVLSNALVERIEVFGSGDPADHAYMIWNFKGKHVKILNNWVDGGVNVDSSQEGIESFGGYDVLISGNTVKNIGTACINLGSADVANSETSGLTITNNYLTGCGIGINLGTSNAENGPQSTEHVHLTGNTIVAVRKTGIDIVGYPGTTMRDITVIDNTIRDIDGTEVAGIKLRTANSAPLAPGVVIANTVSRNHIENIRGSNSHGIRITSYPNVRVLENTITGTDNGAIYSIFADDIEMSGNKIEDGGIYPIQMHGDAIAGFARFTIERNIISWSSPTGAIHIVDGKVGTIKDNIMKRTDSAQPPPILVANGTCGVVISRNVPWYWMEWPGLAVPACP